MSTATKDLRADRLMVRIVGPRRTYPTLIVFLDGAIIHDQQTYGPDAQAQQQHLIDNADDIIHAAYPAASVTRFLNAAPVA